MSPWRHHPVCSDSYLSAWRCLPFLQNSQIFPQVNRGRRMNDGALQNLIEIKASADFPATETKDVVSSNSWCHPVWYAPPHIGAKGLSSCFQNLRIPVPQAPVIWTAMKNGAHNSWTSCLLKILGSCIQNLATPQHLHLVQDPVMSCLGYCSSLHTALLNSTLAPL